MIEIRWLPRLIGMTLRTIVIEISRDMIRFLHTREIRLMTLIAICICNVVVAVDMTLLTLYCLVSSTQRELGY